MERQEIGIIIQLPLIGPQFLAGGCKYLVRNDLIDNSDMLSMATFQEIFCEKHSCPKEQFARRVFWLCLYPHAVILAPVFLLLHGEYFASDRELIASAGRAVDMQHIREDVRDFFWDSNNRGWLRRICYIRVSGQRLKNLARRCLPADKSVPPFEDGKLPA